MLSRPPASSGFIVSEEGQGIYQVVPTTRLSSELTTAILAHLSALFEAGGHATGLLLDVRRSPLLSLVRLSSLIEALSAFNVPLAVVLADETQQRLAILLHNTVRHRERIAYFILREDAALFLARHRTPPRNRG